MGRISKKAGKVNSLTVAVQSISEAQAVSGQHDEYLRLIEDKFNASVLLRGEGFEVIGGEEETQGAAKAIEELLALLRSGQTIGINDVRYVIRMVKRRDKIVEVGESIPVLSKRGFVRPKTPGQRRYVEAIKTHDLVFGIGPAGTGKTYLAVAMAVASLKSGRVSRIILTRPAVEAGEKLGFLPGDIQAKINPYLRPLYDALYDMLPPDTIAKYMDKGIIEVAPLAFMRGRTLNSSFIILDEAQNATIEQMKMFLTRLGFDSKAVVTGDITQIDLPSKKASGLVDVQEVLSGIDGIAFVYFTGEDVVRHELVQRIIEAYENRDYSKEDMG